MPNHVTNRLKFEVNPIQAVRIIYAVCEIKRSGLHVDFNRLIPRPLHVYLGSTSLKDEEDFPINWNSWNRSNWGTKWNAYDTVVSYQDGILTIMFDTAWTPPYPFIAAIFNKFNMPFEFSSICEGWNFAFIEQWGEGDWGKSRISHKPLDRSTNSPEEYEELCQLCFELKGYRPGADEEE